MYNRSIQNIKAFFEQDFHDFQREFAAQLMDEIKSQPKDYILKVSEDEFKEYLKEKYSLDPVTINPDGEVLAPQKTTVQRQSHFDGIINIDAFKIDVRHNYTGSSLLFRMAPGSSRVLTSQVIELNTSNQSFTYSIVIVEKDPQKFERAKSEAYGRVIANLSRLNQEVEQWNNNLPNLVAQGFNQVKKKYQEDNVFFEAIKVKTSSNSDGVYSVPVIKKKIIAQPIVDQNKTLSTDPTLDDSNYKDILNNIYNFGKSFETKQSIYLDKDEEHLRDLFLPMLESRYEGATANGEAFNHKGKTDILIKYQDGTNLFIAECKIWKGESEFLKAISQLFERYLTWRDSKTAIIMFVNNQDLSSVINTVKQAVPKHEYYVQHVGDRKETSFSYKFHIPGDKAKPVWVEVILFHYKK